METLVCFELLPGEIKALREAHGARSVDLLCQLIIRAHLRRMRFKAAGRARRLRRIVEVPRANGHDQA